MKAAQIIKPKESLQIKELETPTRERFADTHKSKIVRSLS